MTPSEHPWAHVHAQPLARLRPWILAFCAAWVSAAPTPAQADAWQQRHDRIVERLRLLAAKEGIFGAAYQPLYHAALPWYGAWGGANRDAVESDGSQLSFRV